MPDWVVPLAALLGIVVGAVLKGAVDVWLDERRARAQERAALRLLGQDLADAHSTLKTTLANEEWWPPSWALTWSAWDDYRELLAARLETGDWVKIAGAFSLLQSISVHVAAALDLHQTKTDPTAGRPPFIDADKNHVTKILVVVEAAQERVQALLTGT